MMTLSCEKAILVAVNDGSIQNMDDSMEELKGLAEAAGAQVVKVIIQNKEKTDKGTYVGQGKLAEIKSIVTDEQIELVLFNDELSAIQLKNIGAEVDCKIVDRTGLILDIFAQRARSKEGKLQVSLAQLKYRLPRLIGSNEHLSRTGGGIGTRGPGETKLEMDRRAIREQINRLKSEIEEISEKRKVSRKKRQKSNIPVVALVGYTNAGKSTLMNMLSVHEEESHMVLAKDMLFATLDTTLRRAKLNNGKEILLIDTVGFVSRLPHYLIAAFKSTLEELQYADVIVHVMDGSGENLNLQKETTLNVLKELQIKDKPILQVYNKKDLLSLEERQHLEQETEDGLFISALDEEDGSYLLEKIEEILSAQYQKQTLLIPYDKQGLLTVLHEKGTVEILDYLEEGTLIETVLDREGQKRYEAYIQ